MMHFSLFQISRTPLFRIFQSLGKFVPTFPKNVCFIHENFWRPFFSRWVWILNFSLLSLKRYISTYFGKFIISPFQIPPDLVKCTCFAYFSYFSFPPSFTMMHLFITQCTYWKPLLILYIPLANDLILRRALLFTGINKGSEYMWTTMISVIKILRIRAEHAFIVSD